MQERVKNDKFGNKSFCQTTNFENTRSRRRNLEFCRREALRPATRGGGQAEVELAPVVPGTGSKIMKMGRVTMTMKIMRTGIVTMKIMMISMMISNWHRWCLG